jgi:hypothetical protein
VVRQQEYCQTPKVLLGENNYAVVPRYAKIMATLQGGAEIYSRVPTHVVIAAAELHQTARGDGAATPLPPGTLLTEIKAEGEYAFVAKDGKPLGYVLRKMLLEIK